MINLMPPEIKQSIRYARYNVSLIQYCILAAIVSAALAGTMIFGYTLIVSDENDIKRTIEERQALLSELKAQETAASELSSRIDTIGALLNLETNYSDTIQNIGALMPQGARLTDLNLTQASLQSSFNLTALVDTQSKAAVLQQNIENSPLFSGADIQDIAPGDLDDNNQIINYSTSLVVRFASEAEIAANQEAEEEGQTSGGGDN